MSGEAWAFLGSTVGGLVAIVVAVVRTRGTAEAGDRSASASEVAALGERLDKQAERLDKQDGRIAELERRDRVWRRFFDEHHALHVSEGWPTFDLPEELA